MSFKEKVKESIVSRASEGLAISASLILILAASKIGPILLPAIESALSKDALVSLLLASLALNIVFLALFVILHKKPEFQLKYSIYWDKGKSLIAQIAKYHLIVMPNIEVAKVISVNLAIKYSR